MRVLKDKKFTKYLLVLSNVLTLKQTNKKISPLIFFVLFRFAFCYCVQKYSSFFRRQVLSVRQLCMCWHINQDKKGQNALHSSDWRHWLNTVCAHVCIFYTHVVIILCKTWHVCCISPCLIPCIPAHACAWLVYRQRGALDPKVGQHPLESTFPTLSGRNMHNDTIVNITTEAFSAAKQFSGNIWLCLLIAQPIGLGWVLKDYFFF